jgi:hypothetical protein
MASRSHWLRSVFDRAIASTAYAFDLDFDNAYALAQMQRQFSHWHRYWKAVWGDEVKRLEMGTIVQGWVESVRRMAGVLV